MRWTTYRRLEDRYYSYMDAWGALCMRRFGFKLGDRYPCHSVSYTAMYGTAPGGSLLAFMAIIVWQRHPPKRPLLERFGKTLRESSKDLLDQPLPEAWDDLINRLNEGSGLTDGRPPAPSTPKRSP